MDYLPQDILNKSIDTVDILIFGKEYSRITAVIGLFVARYSESSESYDIVIIRLFVARYPDSNKSTNNIDMISTELIWPFKKESGNG